MITTETCMLTPALANYLLENNTTNRPLSESTVAKYVAMIKRGEWEFNGETITIFSNGKLGNGQHRCHAVIRANIAVEVIIVRGVAPTTFNTFDGGKPRSASDALAIAGKKYYAYLATAARAYVAYFSSNTFEAKTVSTQQIEKCVEDHPLLNDFVKRIAVSAILKKFSARLTAYLTIAAEIHGQDIVFEFLNQLELGANLSQTSPAYLLRDRVFAQSASSKLTAERLDAFVIKALNAHIDGKLIKILKVSADEGRVRISGT